MVRLNRIYTRTGDRGTTALARGGRRRKNDLRVEAYGTIDETNAAIGVARLSLAAEDAIVDMMLARVQNDLFDLGAELASPRTEGETDENSGARLTVTQPQVERLEKEIDELNAGLAPLTSFVLPGGTAAAVHLHLARAICRRAERIMFALADAPGESVDEPALRYVNRLSDLLFVAARYVNRTAGDVLWTPGGTR